MLLRVKKDYKEKMNEISNYKIIIVNIIRQWYD